MFISKFILASFSTASFALAAPQLILANRNESDTVTVKKTGHVDFDFGTTPVRGVNLGGWLVLEPWITPSIFDKFNQSLGIQDEWTLCEKLGRARALEVLKPHWDSWCTHADFVKIKNAGFNSVRIPIGYWAFADYGEPYTSGAWTYLDAAIDWARETGLKIWIDLHGAPGSQNGFDNSGHKSHPHWGTGDTIRQTLDVLKIISEKYAKHEYGQVIVAIELLNEPAGFALDLNMIQQFYRDGFYETRYTSDTPVAISDAFVPAPFWNEFLTPQDGNAQNVILDHHEYQVFSDSQVSLQPWEHRKLVCKNRHEWAPTGGVDKWQVVGEWSAAMTDCAPHLNGYKSGTRYEGTLPGSNYHGSCADKNHISNWSQEWKNDVRGYIEAQLDTYEKDANGWFFWNFKTELGAHEWDAFALLDAGLFPQPLDNRWFGPACSD